MRILAFSILLVMLSVSCTTTGKTESYLAQGNKALQDKDYAKALEQYDLALKSDTIDPRIPYNKAIALFLSEDYQSAETLCLTSFSQYPHHLKFLSLAEQCAEKREDSEDAVALFEQILSLNPGDTDTRIALMQYAAKSGNSEVARREAQWFIDRHASLSDAYATLATLDGEDSLSAEISAYLKANATVKKET